MPTYLNNKSKDDYLKKWTKVLQFETFVLNLLKKRK